MAYSQTRTAQLQTPSLNATEAEGRASFARRAFIALAFLSLGATAAQLAIDRHWGGATQYIPWVAAAVALGAIAMLTIRPGRFALMIVRVIALALLVVSAVGVYLHIDENYSAGASRRGFGEEWATMSESERWWGAATGGVQGPPALAPSALAFTGTLLLAATWGHPALSRARAGAEEARSSAQGSRPGRSIPHGA